MPALFVPWEEKFLNMIRQLGFLLELLTVKPNLGHQPYNIGENNAEILKLILCRQVVSYKRKDAGPLKLFKLIIQNFNPT